MVAYLIDMTDSEKPVGIGPFDHDTEALAFAGLYEVGEVLEDMRYLTLLLVSDSTVDYSPEEYAEMLAEMDDPLPD